MNTIAFELKGKHAMFKSPDVNEYIFDTFSHIHKIALLGTLGSILGYKGRTQQKIDIDINGENEKNIYPEFYEKLKNLKTSIVPHGDRGYFSKKMQYFNNSTGFANKKGSTLQVREFWLENPHWTIYLLNDGLVDKEVFNKLEDYLLNRKCVYIPYLGKNDHPATIENVRVVDVNKLNECEYLDSLFLKEKVVLDDLGDTFDDKSPVYFEQHMPVSLDDDNYYEYDKISHTNVLIDECDHEDVYSAEDRNLFFF